VSVIVRCDRCSKRIDPVAGIDSDRRQTTIMLNMGEQCYTYTLHKKCANKFQREFNAWIRNAILNPPR
jgi:hypothetical protein